MAIYVMTHLKGDGLEEIGRAFKVAKYSSVSSVLERMKPIMEKNRDIRARVVALEEEINYY